jgi:hypothetical protein
MKKITYLLSNLMIVLSLASTTFGQTKDPVPLNDATVSQRLDKDFDSRNADLSNAIVNWYSTDYGYYGTYSNNNQDYMIRYDKNGNYIETLTKKDWSKDVPADLKNSYDKSSYKDGNVKGYWQVSDPNRKGYYLEVEGKDGKTSRVWADSNGQFSERPSTTTR